jgi:hypothetical protein
VRREEDAIRSLRRFFGSFLLEPWDVRLTVEAGIEPQRPYALVEQNAPASWDGSTNLQEATVAYTASLFLPEAGSRQAADDVALALREQVFQAVKWGPDLRRPTTDRIPLYCYEPRNEVQRVTVRGSTGTWRLGFDSAWTPDLESDAGEGNVQAALDSIEDGNTMVVARGGGVFDVIFTGALEGEDVAPLELDATQLAGGAPSLRVVLEGAPAPWRSERDFMRVESFGQTTIRDEDNPALVMVAVDLRCTFARGRALPFDQMLLQRISATGSSGG